MQDIEREIAHKLIRAILDCEEHIFKISVGDGEEFVVKRSMDFDTIIAGLGHTEMNDLILRDANNNRIGSITLIWGNGVDVISDHTDIPVINQIVESVA